MKLLGHYEPVPIRNSNRKVEVYFPHFISKVFPLIPINGWPFLILWPTGERIADLALWVIKRRFVKEEFHQVKLLPQTGTYHCDHS